MNLCQAAEFVVSLIDCNLSRSCSARTTLLKYGISNARNVSRRRMIRWRRTADGLRERTGIVRGTLNGRQTGKLDTREFGDQSASLLTGL